MGRERMEFKQGIAAAEIASNRGNLKHKKSRLPAQLVRGKCKREGAQWIYWAPANVSIDPTRWSTDSVSGWVWS